MILGFTGTRKGMTAAQRDGVIEYIHELGYAPAEIDHGGAPGADEEFDQIVTVILGLAPHSMPEMSGVRCEVYPATVERFSFWRWRDRAFRLVHTPIDPLKRNRIIVNRSDQMLATPAEAEEQQRGGTWSTIRYARKVGKPTTIIGPDGAIL